MKRTLLSAAILSAITPVRPAMATNRAYIGGPGTGSWSTASNWSPSGQPQQDDSAIIVNFFASPVTVLFNPSGQFLFTYNTIQISNSGAGTTGLVCTSLAPEAVTLNVGTHGVYTQGGTNLQSFFTNTILGGGTISVLNTGTFNTVNLTHSSGTLEFGPYNVSGTYSLQGGALRGATINNNGTFLFTATSFADGGSHLVNNGTLLYNGAGSLDVVLENHGTIAFNSNTATFDSIVNDASFTLPAFRGLVAKTLFGIDHQAGTLTQLGSVTSPIIRVRDAVWDQRGGVTTVVGGGSSLVVGSGGDGEYRLSDGTLLASSMLLGFGNPSVRSGTFTQSGGTVTIGPQLLLVGDNTGRGFYNMSGGTLTTPGLVIGGSNSVSGSFTMSGGLVQTGTVAVSSDGTSPGSLTISGGSFTVSSSFPVPTNHGSIVQTGGSSKFPFIDGTGSMSVNGSALMTLRGIRQDSLSIGGGARILAFTTNTPARTSRLRSLSFEEVGPAVLGSWDLFKDALVVDYTGTSPAPAIQRYLESGFAGGNWNGTGLNSSAAASANPHNTALGFAESSQIFGPGGGVFAGVAVDDSAALVKYTWYGDTDLNGRVNFDDYVHTDNGFTNHLTGWFNGDFDYNGQVNFDDYVLIDLAFNTQSGTLGRALRYLDSADVEMDRPALREVREHLQQFGRAYADHFLAAVPEPAAPGVVAMMTAASCRRRRQGRQAAS